MKKLALLLPFLAGVLWGTSGVFVRFLTAASFSSITIIGARLLVSSTILVIVLWVRDRSLFRLALKDLPVIAGAGVFGSLGLNICLNVAIMELTLSFSTLLLAMTPIFVMPMAAILYKEKITAKKLFCVLLAIAGCVLLSGVLEGGEAIKLSVLGVVTGVGSAVFNAGYTILSKAGSNRGYDPFVITFYAFLSALIVLIPFVNWPQVFSYAASGPIPLAVIIGQSLLCGVLPYSLYCMGLKYVESAKAAILATIEPVAAMVLGLLFFAEIPTPLNLVGMAICIGALCLLVTKDKLNENIT